jgi:hypothetical protein
MVLTKITISSSVSLPNCKNISAAVAQPVLPPRDGQYFSRSFCFAARLPTPIDAATATPATTTARLTALSIGASPGGIREAVHKWEVHFIYQMVENAGFIASKVALIQASENLPRPCGSPRIESSRPCIQGPL